MYDNYMHNLEKVQKRFLRYLLHTLDHIYDITTAYTVLIDRFKLNIDWSFGVKLYQYCYFLIRFDDSSSLAEISLILEYQNFQEELQFFQRTYLEVKL